MDVSLPNVELSHDELVTLSNALNEVLHGPDAIEEWEFQTRIGASRDDGNVQPLALVGVAVLTPVVAQHPFTVVHRDLQYPVRAD